MASGRLRARSSCTARSSRSGKPGQGRHREQAATADPTEPRPCTDVGCAISLRTPTSIWSSSVQDDSAATTPNYVELTSDVVSAYVSNNSVSRAELPALIGSVHAALSVASAPVAVKELTPPVPINKTIRPDYIVSLEDGRQYRSLKRHLTARGLSPEQYRAKWGLRPDYPMVAPSYSKARSELARPLGLGQKAAGRKRKAGKKG